MIALAARARQSALQLQTLSHSERLAILQNLHSSLINNKDDILNENLQDVQLNTQHNLEKRLLLTSDKFDSMAQGVLDICQLPDPLVPIWTKSLDDDLTLHKMACPIGVILVIFESRPEVVIQIAALCIKSGNACILKGGKESRNTVTKFQSIISSLFEAFQPIQFVHSRENIDELITLNENIDLVIPRGSKQLVQHIQKHSTIPVLGHADGICSIFVDEFADFNKSLHCVVDAKTDYPAGCNALETLLIHQRWPKEMTKALLEALLAAKVAVKASQDIISDFPQMPLEAVQEIDFDTEFLDLVVAVKYVPSLNAAIEHIHEHSSKHTDCIMTENNENANVFLRSVDSAGVYLNCSTRFADGFRYGFGAEIGVSTNKIHARGPVGLEGLLIYKYILKGNGQGAADYRSKSFKHQMLETKTPFK